MSELLNRRAPDFSLPAANGPRLSLTDLRGHIVVLHFWSAACAWSRRADVLLVYRSLKWTPLKVSILGIASNFAEKEGEILHEIERRGVRYPVLLDLDQSVANTYRAKVTPQFFILDRRGTVRYTGALDDATLEQPKPKVLYVDSAVNALLANRTPQPETTPPYGCPISRPSALEIEIRPPSSTAARPATVAQPTQLSHQTPSTPPFDQR
ncbi:MAG: redoxin domain-containing protein [Anaerolineales bacterium]|nr:redoxin domain-containing protein [Anaerolineales bacterium]